MDVVSFSKAKKAHALAQTAQEQLHQAVADGDQLAETQQARVDSKGNPHTTLHERINAERSEINAQITAERNYVNNQIAQVNQSISEIELTPGANGKSAYEIWLEQGNIGTEEDFLDSLKGEKGEPGSGGGSGSLTFNTLAELEAVYPNGTNQPAWVVETQKWYYWDADEQVPPDPDPDPEEPEPDTLTVSVTPNAGTYTAPQSVTLTTNRTATIYYTLDGTEPTTTSAVYTTPIPIDETTTLRYFAEDSENVRSQMYSRTYTISEPSEPEDAEISKIGDRLIIPASKLSEWVVNASYSDENYIVVGTNLPVSQMFDFSDVISAVESDVLDYGGATIAGLTENTWTIVSDRVYCKLPTTLADTLEGALSHIGLLSIKLVTGHKTFSVPHNVTNVTTRAATEGFEYFKCTLPSIGDFDSDTPRYNYFVSNGYLYHTSFVWTYSVSCLKINADGTMEMLLPIGTIGSIDATSVSAYLQSQNLEVYHV